MPPSLRPAKKNVSFRLRWYLALAIFLMLAGFGLAETLPAYTPSSDVLFPPGRGHWLGTNGIGQDVFSGLIRGVVTTVFLSFSAAFLSLFLALTVSGVAAFGSARMRRAVLRLADVFQVMPSILILLLFAAWTQPGFVGLVLMLTATSWHEDLRVTIPVLRRELTRENVGFARRIGAGRVYCMQYHVLPAIWPVIIVLYLQNIRQATLKGAGLAFLGLTDPRLLTWGSMIQDATEYLYTPAWSWLLLPPTVALSIFLFYLQTFGESRLPNGRRAHHDPR